MIVEELVSLTPSALMEFYELNVRDLPGYSPLGFELHLPNTEQGIYRFYAWGLNELEKTVIWQGHPYIPYPIAIQGFTLEGEKQAPRPTLTVSNLDSMIQDLIYKYEDIVGAKVVRKRTFAKFLDKENFENNINPTEDRTSQFPDTVYYVRKKQSENVENITFELAAAWDIEGLKLPRRVMISDVCSWKYRGKECGYGGDTYLDIQDNPCAAEEDYCAKRMSSCVKRFGDGNPIRFGGFPIIGRKE